jgi:TRAP-type mannitol/chloroaromatic compound transport system permease large subunit
MWILFAAHAFSTAYTTLGAHDFIQGLMAQIPGGKWGALAFMLFVLFLRGMVLDPVGIMLITLPVFLPIVDAAGFDPIWFGVIFIIMMEIGYMTPPFGFNLFYIKGVAPPSVTMGEIYSSVIPYVIVTMIGVLGAFVAAAINKQLSVEVVHHAAIQTLRLTTLIMWILFAAHAFSTAYTTLGAHDFIQHLMSLIPGGKWGALAFMLFVLFLLGMVLDPVGIMLITLPVFLPIVDAAGFDPIWFGVIFIIMMEIGYMTPPFGFNLFYIKGVAPPSVTMGEIYSSVVPYVIVTLIGVLIIILVPDIALYFPNLFFGKG